MAFPIYKTNEEWLEDYKQEILEESDNVRLIRAEIQGDGEYYFEYDIDDGNGKVYKHKCTVAYYFYNMEDKR